MQVDIIGGGLSGLSTAIAVKTHDPQSDVFVHEKHAAIGLNHDARKCGEAHSIESFSMKWKPPKDTIASEVHRGTIIIGNKTYLCHRKPGTAWILDRPLFIQYLGKQAKDAGAEIVTNDHIKDISNLSADFIVDASGCPSFVKKQLGIPHRLLGYGYQQTLRNCSAFEEHTSKVIFDKMNGYYWIFPRNPAYREVNIGVGFWDYFGLPLRVLLEDFKIKNNIQGSIEYCSGGLIPGGLQTPLHFKNIVFVGDAGVGTYPLNGQGIYRALMSGDAAGRYIAQGNLKGYSMKMKEAFIKMDVIGKSFQYMNRILRLINPELILSSYNLFNSLNHRVGFFESAFESNVIQVSKDD